MLYFLVYSLLPLGLLLHCICKHLIWLHTELTALVLQLFQQSYVRAALSIKLIFLRLFLRKLF